MARFQFDLPTEAAPEAVRTALLDFSERRPELWPGLPRDQYEVYEVGDTWAEIREGYRGPIWWRERYDWSVPGRVEWIALDSGFGALGSFDGRVATTAISVSARASNAVWARIASAWYSDEVATRTIGGLSASSRAGGRSSGFHAQGPTI
jgi:hypothetical protein